MNFRNQIEQMKHIKSILIGALVLMSTTLSAQDKLGHVNSQEILQAMPETKQAEMDLQALTEQLEGRMQALRADYQMKVQEFQSLPQETPSSTVNDMKDEIINMETRIAEFQNNAEQDLVVKQQELLTPLIEKVQNAIDAVGQEKGFIYIFDTSSGAVIYKGGEDIAPLIKEKLGITG